MISTIKCNFPKIYFVSVFHPVILVSVCMFRGYVCIIWNERLLKDDKTGREEIHFFLIICCFYIKPCFPVLSKVLFTVYSVVFFRFYICVWFWFFIIPFPTNFYWHHLSNNCLFWNFRFIVPLKWISYALT